MQITKAQILDKLASWSQDDWDGAMEVWKEIDTDQTVIQFAIDIAARNVMFETLEEEA